MRTVVERSSLVSSFEFRAMTAVMIPGRVQSTRGSPHFLRGEHPFGSVSPHFYRMASLTPREVGAGRSPIGASGVARKVTVSKSWHETAECYDIGAIAPSKRGFDACRLSCQRLCSGQWWYFVTVQLSGRYCMQRGMKPEALKLEGCFIRSVHRGGLEDGHLGGWREQASPPGTCRAIDQ